MTGVPSRNDLPDSVESSAVLSAACRRSDALPGRVALFVGALDLHCEQARADSALVADQGA